MTKEHSPIPDIKNLKEKLKVEDWRCLYKFIGIVKEVVTLREAVNNYERLREENEKLKKKIKQLPNKKFPIGKRKWCIECAERIAKSLLEESSDES
jgi:aspartate oxidase